MARVAATVVALVGGPAQACAAAVGRAANVQAVVPDEEAPALERAAEAWRRAQAAHVPYLVHDADPLAAVAGAWARRFDEEGPAGELEVAAHEALARWRARAVDLPDYYLVLDPDALDPTRRHWYLGFLHRAAPVRVVPAAGQPEAVAAALTRLPAGRWWPPLDRLLDGVERVVPDRVGGPSDATAPPGPSAPGLLRRA